MDDNWLKNAQLFKDRVFHFPNKRFIRQRVRHWIRHCPIFHSQELNPYQICSGYFFRPLLRLDDPNVNLPRAVRSLYEGITESGYVRVPQSLSRFNEKQKLAYSVNPTLLIRLHLAPIPGYPTEVNDFPLYCPNVHAADAIYNMYEELGFEADEIMKAAIRDLVYHKFVPWLNDQLGPYRNDPEVLLPIFFTKYSDETNPTHLLKTRQVVVNIPPFSY